VEADLQTNTREVLLEQLFYLTVSEWPVYDYEWTTRQDADQKLYDRHLRAFHCIKTLASTDAEASAFIQKVYDSISRPNDAFGGTFYDAADLIPSARQLARKTYRRLREELDARRDEERRYPVETGKREFIRERAKYDPFYDDVNVCVDGLPNTPKTRVQIDPMNGSIIPEF